MKIKGFNMRYWVGLPGFLVLVLFHAPWWAVVLWVVLIFAVMDME